MSERETCLECRREFPVAELVFWLPDNDEAWDAWSIP